MTYPSTPTPSGFPPSSSGLSSTTSPFTTPLTQNTAPVIKHRCLFTHDTRRKAKRWQDGYLRYHTFNKRIMAYDTSGNFIGDLHWRQDAAVQDGDELELDRGVLVQVCEAVGRSETDLGAVLSHSYPNSHLNGVAGGGNGKRGFGAASTQGSLAGSQQQQQQSMRSLNDLLGIKKTTPALGGTGSGLATSGLAATRVMQGPERGAGELSAARAAKRQRVDGSGLGLGSGAVEGGLFALQQVPTRRVLAQPVQPRPRPAVVDLTGSSTALVTNPAATATATSTRLQSHDLERQRADSRTSVQAKSMSREEGSTIPPQRQASRKEGSNPPQLPSSRKESSYPLPQRQATRNANSNPPQLPSSREESNSAPEEPPVLLRLSTSKRRKKLMYSALLPGGGGKVAKPASSAPAPAPAPVPAPPRNNKNPPPPAQPPTTTTATPPKPHDFTPSTSTQTILNDLITAPPRVPPNPRNHTPTTTKPNTNPLNPINRNPRSNIPTHTSLRKSYSDPTALATTTTVHRANHTTIPDPAGDDPFDQGPWTREALDLFDFWPAGRAKPV